MKTVTLLLGAALLFAWPSAARQWTPELSMQFVSVGPTDLSPDGSRVAFQVREAVMEGEESEYQMQIRVVSTGGGDARQYTHGKAPATSPAFSPDGKHLAFLSRRTDETQVWVLPMDGGEAEQVTEASEGVFDFRWSPRGTRIAYTMRDPETEGEEKRRKQKRDVIVVDADFKYAHLYAAASPKDTTVGKGLSSGAFHSAAFEWSPDAAGIVFTHQPDPRINSRGSSGYGREFRYANVQDWGYGDYEDVMSGVDAAIDMGVAYPDSFTVMGWIYGGYLMSLLVTRTD